MAGTRSKPLRLHTRLGSVPILLLVILAEGICFNSSVSDPVGNNPDGSVMTTCGHGQNHGC
jgi:hypothetical protein